MNIVQDYSFKLRVNLKNSILTGAEGKLTVVAQKISILSGKDLAKRRGNDGRDGMSVGCCKPRVRIHRHSFNLSRRKKRQRLLSLEKGVKLGDSVRIRFEVQHVSLGGCGVAAVAVVLVNEGKLNGSEFEAWPLLVPFRDW